MLSFALRFKQLAHPKPLTRLALWLNLPMLSLLYSTSSFAQLDEFDFDDELTSADVPLVLTTTRLRQARSEAPGSISIISRQMILHSGARDIPELLRFVPGMSVAKEFGHTYQVSYHGTNFAHSKRMQVLIDGHSVYDAALANVDWELLPIALKDIARIEVARGPNTATHGANAYLGVINIISLKADEGAKANIELSRGSYDVNDAYLRYRGQINQHHLSLSVSQEKDEGFDKKPDTQVRIDSKTRRVINANWQFESDSGTSMDTQLALSRTQRLSDIDEAINMQAPPVRNSDNLFFNTDIRHDLDTNQQLALKFNLKRNQSERRFQACAPGAFLSSASRDYYVNFKPDFFTFLNNPLHIPTDPEAQQLQLALINQLRSLPDMGQDSFCGELNEDYREYIANFELSHTWHIGDKIRTLSGINLRHDQIASQTFFKGEFQRFSYQLFNSSEYKINPTFTANIGFMYEDGEHLEGTLTPRVAFNAKLNTQHNLRLVHAQAIRKPALFETQANWSYEAINLSPEGVFSNNRAEFFELALGNPNLRNEEIHSLELGLHSRWQRLGLETDIRLFDDKLRHLISERPVLNNFTPTNNNQAKQRGAELEFNYQLSTLTQLRLSYAYIQRSATSANETSFTPNHNVSVFFSHQLSEQWSINSAYFYQDNIRNNHYKRADFGLRFQTQQFQTQWFAQLQLQHRIDNDPVLRSINLYQHDTHIRLNLGLNF